MILIIGGTCQGKTEYAKEHFGGEYRIVDDYHEAVRSQLLEGKEFLQEAERLLAQEEKLVIISNEIGYGLVPMEEFERRYREAVGRVNCLFAKQAEQVIRLLCGIGTRIK